MATRQSGPRDGEWQRQDGQIVYPDAHVQERWDERAPPAWEGFSVRAAWTDGEPVEFGDAEVAARVHAASGMLLVSRLGFLHTTIPAADRGFDVDVGVDGGVDDA